MNKNKDVNEEQKETTVVPKELITEMENALSKANETINKQKEDVINEHDRYLRALADYQNLQRNSTITISKSKEAGKLSIFKDLIPIMDNFEKAIESGEVTEGIMLIYNSLKSVFDSNNVEVINPKEGEQFTDSLHEAIAPTPGNEDNKNTISFVQFKGYKLGDNILRYAKVGVYV